MVRHPPNPHALTAGLLARLDAAGYDPRMRLRSASLLVCVASGCFNPDDSSGSGGTETATGTAGTSMGEGNEAPTSADDAPGDTTVDTTQPTDDGVDASTGTLPCDGADGELDDDCSDPQAPFCLGGECVGCDAVDENACAAIDPATPICAGGACSGCTEHDQCPTGACRIATGECFAAANRLWVDNTAADCPGATGEEDSPLCAVVDARNLLDAQPGVEPWAVFVAGSPTPYPDAISGEERPTAWIGPARGLAARIERESAAVSVYPGGELYVARLSITAGADMQAAINAYSGLLWLDDLTVRGTSSGALATGVAGVRSRRCSLGSYGRTVHVAPMGSLVLEDGQITDNSGAMLVDGDATLIRSFVHFSYVEGGIEVNGTLRATNSMIYDSIYQFGDIQANPGSVVDLLYTVIGPDGLTCPGTPGQSEQTIRNSIVLSIDCPSAVITSSAVGTDAAVSQGVGNVLITEADYASVFVAPNGSGDSLDYHVLPGAPIVTDLAEWNTDDPETDIDGDPRPTRDGATDVAGADVP